MPKLRIHFVSANAVPTSPLRIDLEKRAIQDALRYKAQISESPRARISDLITDLDNNKPNIVHFTAHGSPAAQIMLFSEEDQPKAIPRTAIQRLFKTLKGRIRLVVLSACYSGRQAEQIRELIDCVIGVEGAVPEDAARKYSVVLYRTLSQGLSVQAAHDRGLIVLDELAVPEEKRPNLLVRDGVDAAQVFPGGAPRKLKTAPPIDATRPVRQPTKAPRPVLDQDYGISADEFEIFKKCHPNGSCEIHFTLKNLAVTRGEVKWFEFMIESTAGIVGDPVLDEQAGALSLDWKRTEGSPRRTLTEVMEQARIWRGRFEFAQPISPKTDPVTFGWKLTILNCDAISAWDYRNLYGAARQAHINGKKLERPTEYFARLVWFPLARLTLRLELPPGCDNKPRPRYFELAGSPKIPSDEIMSAGVLGSHPFNQSAWAQQHTQWEANVKEDKALEAKLKHEGGSTYLFSTDNPVVGSYYALDWGLVDPPVDDDQDRLINEAAIIRKGLIEHRKRRLEKKLDTVSLRIVEMFELLHNKVKSTYGMKKKGEKFETALMTYSEQEFRMVMVEGFASGGEMAPRTWDFRLPYGLGVSGACFRLAQAIPYAREVNEAQYPEPLYFLQDPESDPYSCLLSLPIDHPEFYDDMGESWGARRCRQVVAVLTIGSTYPASPLRPVCRTSKRPTDTQLKSLAELRQQCQKICDQFSRLLLGDTDSISPE